LMTQKQVNREVVFIPDSLIRTQNGTAEEKKAKSKRTRKNRRILDLPRDVIHDFIRDNDYRRPSRKRS